MPMNRGPGEASHKESYAPPSVRRGLRGGLEQCGNQGAVEESGLKGGSEGIPSETAGTSPSEKHSRNKSLEERGSFHDGGNRP